MKISEAEHYTTFETKELMDEARKTHFKSMYRFLSHHNGFRPKNIHLFLGTSGGGKSTMIRSLVIDVLSNIKKGKKLLMWLSEESVDEFIVEIAKTGLVKQGRELFKRIHFFSEQDYPEGTPQEFFTKLHEFINSGEYSFLLIDNITTSSFYMDKTHTVQAEIAKHIKALIQKANIPCVLIAHTGAAVSDSMSRMIEPNDIRGSKTIINLSQFIYILQTFYILKKRVPTLRTQKHRGQLVEENIFKLEFNPDTFIFQSDCTIDFKQFKEIFKARNVL